MALCQKAKKRPIAFNCKFEAGHVGNCSPYTLPPGGREAREAYEVTAEPATMTVRVVDRGTQVGYEYPVIRTVTIAAVCPKDGGPRGEPRPHRFCEDGGWLTCDRWTNPCGHVDYYGAVLVEAGLRPALTAKESA